MKLLFVTQIVDRNDTVLGAYHEWIRELAQHVERIEVICLYEGEHDLSANVRVHSLGKERASSLPRFLRRAVYLVRFKRLAWKLRRDYDAVFVHMNQEYILIAGPMWKLLGKRVYMWRNHYAGSFFTDIAASFCTRVFCTSRFSYTARYKKTVLMPVGVDMGRFHPDANRVRKPRSILFLARMSPSKDPLLLLEALRELSERDVPFTATFVGSPTLQDEAYYRSLVTRAEEYTLSGCITFLPAVPNRQTPDLYRTHEIFVNTSRSGMFDKTIFEAAASGCEVLAASGDFALTFPDRVYATSSELAALLAKALSAPQKHEGLEALASRHSLVSLATELVRAMRAVP